jgi:ketosteroid isomerase-like protein
MREGVAAFPDKTDAGNHPHHLTTIRDQVMTMTATDNLAVARKYFEALENGAEGGTLADFFTKDVVQEEFPNRLSPIGVHRDLDAILASARRGKQTIRAQKFEVLRTVVDGDSVALEVFWSGLLAIPVDTLPADTEMRAHVSVWLEFRDGKICRQHNYDCFDPWWV